MSVKRTIAVVAAALGLAATGVAPAGATGSQDWSSTGERVDTGGRGVVSSSSTGVEGLAAATGTDGCAVYPRSVSPTRRLTTHAIIGTADARSYYQDTLPFQPRLLAVKGSTTGRTAAGTTYTKVTYYGVSSRGYLHRLDHIYSNTLAPGSAPFSYVKRTTISSGWYTTKDISISSTRFYYLTATGEMRRRAIQSDGTVTPRGTLLGTGITDTLYLSRAGGAERTTDGVVTGRYDTLLSVDKRGKLTQRLYLYAGTGGHRITVLKSEGWSRFNSVDVGTCPGEAVIIVGRDWDTHRVLTYRDSDFYNFSGSDLTYRGTSGFITYKTFGA